jgi:hypothetical protein
LLLLAFANIFSFAGLVNDRNTPMVPPPRALEDDLNSVRGLLKSSDPKRVYEAYGQLVELTDAFIRRSLPLLPEAERVAAAKFFISEKPLHQIAKEMALPEEEARLMLTSAVHLLREQFKNDNLAAPIEPNRKVIARIAWEFSNFVQREKRLPREEGSDWKEEALALEVKYAHLSPEFRGALDPAALRYYCGMQLSML